MIGLFVSKGSNEGTCFLLKSSEGRYVLGSDKSLSLHLPDPGISSHHAEVYFENDKWWIKDLDSTNGTFVGGLPISRPTEIIPRDKIVIGKVEMQVVERKDGNEVPRKKKNSETLTVPFDPHASILGTSKTTEGMIEFINKVAPLDCTILLEGETGTGKEIVARAIHTLSPRCSKRFVPINCGAIPDNLIESELFGHEKGAFTGADKRHIGHFEDANGGTLFLDEIGDLPLSAQTKLLRVLESKQIRRLGGEHELSVNVRVLAASHKSLSDLAESGDFRKDLLHRLKVIHFKIPSLKERKQDIPVLAKHFINVLSIDMGKKPYTISPEALDCLSQYAWPGNIRELKNVIEAAIVNAPSSIIQVADLQLTEKHVDSPTGRQSGNDSFLSIEEFEKEKISAHIRQAIAKAGGNKKKAAELLGISRAAFYEKIKKYGIE
ncbi:MAG: sigma 54-interacting transcriptional regulator [Bdellovibrio sp.]|nr:sigma 54-interacting transcriptional regulator [Bdellovibrio sp.]